MEYSVNVKISNRHVHLTEETYKLLFDEELTKKNDLNQIGQFAANQTLTIINGDKYIENVRIVGPFRDYNQVEISKRDARALGLNPPVRRSGDLDDSLNITLKTDKASVEVKGLIISNRHVHVNTSDAPKYGVVDKQPVKIKVNGDKGGIMDAEVKVSDDGYYELHIDTDDANSFLLENDDKVTLII
jgi:putative phosphotransacetylase